jgi:hypothetical protein
LIGSEYQKVADQGKEDKVIANIDEGDGGMKG